MRRLLVQAAHAALSCRKDSSLTRWGESLVERSGKSEAVVALARKIAVLLHRLWVTVFEASMLLVDSLRSVAKQSTPWWPSSW